MADMRSIVRSVLVVSWAILLITIDVMASFSSSAPPRQSSASNQISPPPRGPVVASSIPQKVKQTDEDVVLEQWYHRQGILLGPSHRRVQVCTTEKSVGGRGVFLTGNLGSNHGDVLAHIPGHLVLVPSNLQSFYPQWSLHNDANAEPNEGSSASWQSILTAYCWEVLNHGGGSPSTTVSSPHEWNEWIATWGTDSKKSSGGGPQRPIPWEDYRREDIERLAQHAHCGLDQMREGIQRRYETFESDWTRVKAGIIGVTETINTTSDRKDEDYKKQLFGNLYSLVLSRTADLGPEWNHQMGIIPLHDMLNHPPCSRSFDNGKNYELNQPNVELFCLGDIRSTIGNDKMRLLLEPLLRGRRDYLQQQGKNIRDDPPMFSDKDFVLASRRPIAPGEELLLSYKDVEKQMNVDEQLWLLLQYGFPFR